MNVKFEWNGIKVNGQLFRCWYSWQHEVNGPISISLKDYDRLPEISGLTIRNDSDYQQDIYNTDKITVTSDNQYYPAVMAALKAKEAQQLAKIINPETSTTPIMDKIKRFAELVEQSEMESLRRNRVDCQANIDQAHALIKPGKKFCKVDIGRLDNSQASGRYMIDMETEQIFGIKGYGVVHKGHHYGTLDSPIIKSRY